MELLPHASSTIFCHIEAITQGRACSHPATREYFCLLWVTSNVDGPSIQNHRILLERHRVKLNERLTESISCVHKTGIAPGQMGKASSAVQLQEALGIPAKCRLEAKDFRLFDKRYTTPAYLDRGAVLKRHR